MSDSREPRLARNSRIPSTPSGLKVVARPDSVHASRIDSIEDVYGSGVDKVDWFEFDSQRLTAVQRPSHSQ